MADTYQLKNSKELLILKRLNAILFLSSESKSIPKCILKIGGKPLNEKEVADIVKLLLKRNCKLISLCGENAEHYHDLADSVIESEERETDVMTTYHDDESENEIANFVVNGIKTVSSERILLIAEDDKEPLKYELLKF